MNGPRWFTSAKTARRVWYASLICACAATSAAIVVVHAASSGPPAVSTAWWKSLPQSKQAIINHMNTFKAGGNPHPASPNAGSSEHIAVQPCTRDLSLFITGITSPHSQADIPVTQPFTFNNEWGDPAGADAIMAGNVVGGAQGVITVERWDPPTNCIPTIGIYLAPADSGSLSISRVDGSTVSLSGPNGAIWDFDLKSDTFQEIP
jgi:hypothetical protein